MSVVLAGAIVGIVSLAGLSAFSLFNQSNQYMQRSFERTDLMRQLESVLRDANTCSCQLNPNLTADDTYDTGLRVNSTVVDGSGTMNVGQVREGCAITNPVFASEGKNLGHGLVIDKVQLVDLAPAGNGLEWRGKWRISFLTELGSSALQPVELFQFFYLDPVSVAASPTAAIIERCKGATTASGLIDACPAGMSMVGASGQFGTYCIDTVERSAKKYLDAEYACGIFRPTGFGPAHLCNQNEWYAACTAGVDPSFINGTWEWIDDNDDTGAPMKGGGGSCGSTNDDYLSAPHSYRCCSR